MYKGNLNTCTASAIHNLRQQEAVKCVCESNFQPHLNFFLLLKLYWNIVILCVIDTQHALRGGAFEEDTHTVSDIGTYKFGGSLVKSCERNSLVKGCKRNSLIKGCELIEEKQFGKGLQEVKGYKRNSLVKGCTLQEEKNSNHHPLMKLGEQGKTGRTKLPS